MARYVKSGTVNTVQEINSELEKIATAQDEFLTRNGEAPNEMKANLDMNGKRITNLPAAVNATDALRLIDLTGEYDVTVGIDETPVFDNIAVMTSTNLAVGQLVRCKRYYSGGDVVDGLLYEIVSPATGTEDGGSFHNLGNGNQAKLLIGDKLSPDQYGARGGNASVAIQAAADYCKLNGIKLFAKRGGSAYVIDTPVDLRGVAYIEFLEDINTSAITTEVAVTVGGFALSGIADIKMASVSSGSVFSPTPPFPTIRIFGSKASLFQFGLTNYLQIYADSAETTGTSNAYNRITLLGVCRRLEYASAVGFSWNTENSVYGGRIIEYYLTNSGGYPHNHNKLYNPTFEGADVDIQFNGVNANWIYGARFESTSSASISFDSESAFNSVEKTWSGQNNPRNQFVNNFININDLGAGNIVTTESSYKFNQTPIFELNAASGMVGSSSLFSSTFDPNTFPDFTFNGIGGQNFATAGLNKIKISSNRWIFISDLIPVRLGDVVRFEFDYEGTLIRPAINVYDGNQKPLTDEAGGGVFWAQPSLSFNPTHGVYQAGADLSSGQLSGAVAREEVKFIRVSLFSGAGGNFNNLNATLFTQNTGRALSSSSAKIQNTPLVIEGIPNQGYLPKYTHVRDAVANTVYKNDFQHESQITTTETVASTSVEVNTISTVANGDIVGILLDDGLTHWSSVSGLASNTFTITSLPSQASAGNRVVFNRWVLVP